MGVHEPPPLLPPLAPLEEPELAPLDVVPPLPLPDELPPPSSPEDPPLVVPPEVVPPPLPLPLDVEKPELVPELAPPLEPDALPELAPWLPLLLPPRAEVGSAAPLAHAPAAKQGTRTQPKFQPRVRIVRSSPWFACRRGDRLFSLSWADSSGNAAALSSRLISDI